MGVNNIMYINFFNFKVTEDFAEYMRAFNEEHADILPQEIMDLAKNIDHGVKFANSNSIRKGYYSMLLWLNWEEDFGNVDERTAEEYYLENKTDLDKFHAWMSHNYWGQIEFMGPLFQFLNRCYNETVKQQTTNVWIV